MKDRKPSDRSVSDPRYVHGRFFFADWSSPHPHDGMLDDALWRMRYAPKQLTRADQHIIMAAADAYRHFAGHPASNTSIVAQLKQVRRAARRIEPRKGDR